MGPWHVPSSGLVTAGPRGPFQPWLQLWFPARCPTSRVFAVCWLHADVGLGQGSCCPTAISPAEQRLNPPGPRCRSDPIHQVPLGRADPGSSPSLPPHCCLCTLFTRLGAPVPGAEHSAVSLFSKWSGPRPPGVRWRSVFVSLRPLHSCRAPCCLLSILAAHCRSPSGRLWVFRWPGIAWGSAAAPGPSVHAGAGAAARWVGFSHPRDTM